MAFDNNPIEWGVTIRPSVFIIGLRVLLLPRAQQTFIIPLRNYSYWAIVCRKNSSLNFPPGFFTDTRPFLLIGLSSLYSQSIAFLATRLHPIVSSSIYPVRDAEPTGYYWRENFLSSGNGGGGAAKSRRRSIDPVLLPCGRDKWTFSQMNPTDSTTGSLPNMSL